MAYDFDTHVSQFAPPHAADAGFTAGTWTPGINAHAAGNLRADADAAFTVFIPVLVPANASTFKGCCLKSIDVFYAIAVKAADDFATVELEKMTLPADLGAPTAAAVTSVTIDSAHDSAAKRLAVAEHRLTVTLDTPAWMGAEEVYYLQLGVDAADTTAFTLYGARFNFDLRM
jgi:hypothetical protein